MSKYTDPVTNFKLIQATDSHAFTKRNMKIWDMILNRLGLPDHLHEFVRGIYLSGNWEETEWDEIPIIRMAENLAPDHPSQGMVYNRLKKNSPKFFLWQDTQSFVIIDREVIRESVTWNKTKIRYRFLLYEIVLSLFNLPGRPSKKELHKAVNDALKDYPKVDKPTRSPKKKRADTTISAIERKINDLYEIEGSKEGAAYEAGNNSIISDFAKLVLQIKGL